MTLDARTARPQGRLGSVAALLLLPLLLAATGCEGCGGRGGLNKSGAQLQLSVERADFGYVIIGQQKELKVVARNIGRGTLNVKNIERMAGFPEEVRFTPPRMQLEPGQEQELTLFFQPVAEGERKGSLVLRNDGTADEWTLDVVGVGVVANLEVTPAKVDFGPVILEEVGSQTVTVKNKAAFALDLLVDPLAGENPEVFRVSVPGPDQRTVRLPAGESVDLSLGFQPAAVGQANALLSVRACTGCDPLGVQLTGKGVAAGVVAEPESLDFGSVLPGVKKTLPLVLHNIGNRKIAVSAVRSQTAEFTVQLPPEAIVLDPGQLTTVQVSFGPSRMGAFNGKLGVDTDDSRQPHFDVLLKGYGGGPVVDVSPAGLDFGKVAIGFPIARRFVVTNKGLNDPNGTADDLVIDGIELGESGDDFTYTLVGGTSLPARIAPGQRQAIEVRYNPTGIGPDQSELRLHVNAVDTDLVAVPLKGEGVMPLPCDYELLPAPSPGLNFGVVQRGRSSRLSFSVRNIGSNECIIGKVDLNPAQTPATTSAFSLGPIQLVPGPSCNAATDPHQCKPWNLPAGPLYGFELAPGDRLVTEVEFSPPGTISAATNFQGAVDLSLSSARAPEQQMGLVGRGAEVCLSITPSGVDFGVVKPLCETNDRTFNIYNACATPVKVSNVKVGQPSSEYRVLLPTSVNFPTPVNLNPQQELRFSVRYRPAEVGPSQNTVEVYTDQSVTSTQPYVLTLAGRGDHNTSTTESFVQANRAKADILFVVDDSGSMDQEQTALGQNFNEFMKFALGQQIDYHLAVTTTGTLGSGCSASDNPPNGKFMPLNSPNRIITPATANPSEVFKTNVNVGTNGCATERPLEAAYLALSDPNLNGPNAGFLRPDAYLSVIIVTDEEDQSGRPVDFYVNYFSNIKGTRGANLVSLSGIIGTTPGGCTSSFGDSEYVERVLNASKRTGGVAESICSENWSLALQKLGLIAFGYKSRFILGSEPDPATLHVFIDGQEVPAGPLWSFTPEANAVDFLPTAVPPAGSTIRIEYAVACH